MNRRSNYASRTEVPAEKTRMEIELMLKKYGATSFAYLSDGGVSRIGFRINNRTVRFDLPMPSMKDKKLKAWEQSCRSRWRALLLCIKSKLEACTIGITTFEQEFLAHIVLPDGRTVGEAAIPQLTEKGPLLLS